MINETVKMMRGYLVTFVSGKTMNIIRDNLLEVAKAFEANTDPIKQVTMERSDVNVGFPTPIPVIPFTTIIKLQAAIDAGCVATPSSFAVPSGTSVVFQATTTAGYTFDGWYIDNVPQGSTFITSIVISSQGQAVEVEARFKVTP